MALEEFQDCNDNHFNKKQSELYGQRTSTEGWVTKVDQRSGEVQIHLTVD